MATLPCREVISVGGASITCRWSRWPFIGAMPFTQAITAARSQIESRIPVAAPIIVGDPEGFRQGAQPTLLAPVSRHRATWYFHLAVTPIVMCLGTADCCNHAYRSEYGGSARPSSLGHYPLPRLRPRLDAPALPPSAAWQALNRDLRPSQSSVNTNIAK